jgi:hypothetical protein
MHLPGLRADCSLPDMRISKSVTYTVALAPRVISLRPALHML